MSKDDYDSLIAEVRRLDAEVKTAKKKGYELALRRVRDFGRDFEGDMALTDEERYILEQAVEELELQGVDDDG